MTEWVNEWVSGIACGESVCREVTLVCRVRSVCVCGYVRACAGGCGWAWVVVCCVGRCGRVQVCF